MPQYFPPFWGSDLSAIPTSAAGSTAISNAVKSEADSRVTADNALDTKAESASTRASSVQANVANESSSRVAADNALDTKAESASTRASVADSKAVSAASITVTGTFAAPITDNPYALAAANCYNGKIYYGQTGEIDLPAGVAGMSIVIYNTGAYTITIDPNGSDVIVRDGTAQAGGVSITLSSGAGNYVSLICDVANHWVTLGYKGTVAAGS